MAAGPPPWRIGLLRAVNLGPHNKVSAAQLRDLMTAEGLAEGRTLLNSGNLVFRDGSTPAALEARLEAALERRHDLSTGVMVRTAEDWGRLIAANPFADAARSDPAHLVLLVLKGAPRPGGLEALRDAIRGREAVAAGDRALYITYPDGIGESKLTAAVIARALGVAGTGRNWNTVLKLAGMAGLPPRP